MVTMINTTTARERIDQLLSLDEQTMNKSKTNAIQTLTYLRSHLVQFIEHYGTDNGLTLSQASESVNNWDINQWKRAIDEFDMSNWSNSATNRVKAIAAYAAINKGHLITGIMLLGLIANTAKNYQTIKNRIISDGVEQTNRLQNKLFPIHRATINKDKQIIKGAEKTPWEKNLWSDNDKIASNIEQLINKNIKRGLTTRKLGKLMLNKTHKTSNPNKYLSDNISQTQTSADRIVRTESSRLIDQINMSTYKMGGVHLVDWVTMPNACPICVSIQDDNPYSIWSVPNIPAHPNCRCIKTIHDDSGSNLINPNLLF